MKARQFPLLAIGVILMVAPAVLRGQTPVGTAFTYQGRLTDGGVPADGSYDFKFGLYDAPEFGSQVGDVVDILNQVVNNGLFTLVLDFGDVFDGTALWLEVWVRQSGPGSYTPLYPRQELTAAPYAVHAETAGAVPGGISGGGTVHTIAKFIDPNSVGDSVIYESAGNVGIGTTGPSTELDVAGTVTADGFVGDGSGLTGLPSGPWETLGADIFYTAGSVGIGTAGPLLPSSETVLVKGATLPTGRYALAAAADPATGRIYCFGGYDYVNEFNQIVEYDPVTDSVTVKSATLPTARRLLAAAADPASGRIYCFGGYGAGSYLNQIVEYDPVSDSVTVKSATLPSGRYALAAAADPAGGRIYCFGGYDGASYLNQIVEYDPVSDSMTVMSATLPTPRASPAAAAEPTTGKICCLGGSSEGADSNQIAEYDPVSDSVAVKSASLPTGRHGLAAATDSATGKIYCFGGYDGSFLNQIVEYTPLFQTVLQVGEAADGTGAIANTWSVFSSRAYKRDVIPLGPPDYQDILAKLNATDAVRFSYAHDARRTLHLGVIAEDAPAEILSPGGKAVSLADYSTFLMAAIKAQQALIEEKECQLTDMQARLARLEAVVTKSAETENGGAR